MAFEYPKVLDDMKEFPAIYNMNDLVNPAIDAENLELDLFISTATEAGISRREKEYGINPKDTDTLEDRRFVLKILENEKLPYTETVLREKLSNICGKDGYALTVLIDKIIVKVFLLKKVYLQTVNELLEKIVPLNVVIQSDLMYNTYNILEEKTYGELNAFTYKQMRDEVL